MRAMQLTGIVLGLAMALVTLGAEGENAPNPAGPEVKNLGDGQYRIGSIMVDKAKGRFRVPARVNLIEPPIEFLLGTRGGDKLYETVLEAEASAIEFNLACILIGLDPQNAKDAEAEAPRMPGAPPRGAAVTLTVSWERDGEPIEQPASRLLLQGDPPRVTTDDDWVYTGGVHYTDGRYLPEMAGVLVGLVHKGESIIEHRDGIGVGSYGSIAVNPGALPAVGARVEIEVAKPSP